MADIAVSGTTDESRRSSTSNQYNGTAYGLAEAIKDTLDVYGLEPGHVSIDVEMESSEDTIDIEYTVETLDWYEEDLRPEEDPVSFEDSYSIYTANSVSDDFVIDALEDNFGDSALKVEGEVIQESFSWEHTAF